MLSHSVDIPGVIIPGILAPGIILPGLITPGVNIPVLVLFLCFCFDSRDDFCSLHNPGILIDGIRIANRIAWFIGWIVLAGELNRCFVPPLGLNILGSFFLGCLFPEFVSQGFSSL